MFFGFRPHPSYEQALQEFEHQERHGMEGRTDVESLKSRLPVVLHADVVTDIEKVADGEQAPILCAEPVEKFSLSSGTSAGKQKLIPVTKTGRTRWADCGKISPVLRYRKFPLPENSAVLAFVFAAKRFRTRSGLMAGTATSNYFHSDEFARRNHEVETLTSPDEVILRGADFKQVMYCHLLCGLLRRNEVGVVMSFFAFMLVEALRMLESSWEDLCEDIRTGSLSSHRVTDPALIEAQCRKESPWEGVVARLWPNVKFVLCVMTGAMAPYTSSLRHYAGSVPLVNSDYGASESFPIGINMNPLDPPEKVVFTLVPTCAFFEFAALPQEDSQKNEMQIVNINNLVILFQDFIDTDLAM